MKTVGAFGQPEPESSLIFRCVHLAEELPWSVSSSVSGGAYTVQIRLPTYKAFCQRHRKSIRVDYFTLLQFVKVEQRTNFQVN